MSTVANRAYHSNGCPFCSGRRPIVGETDLWTTHPNLATELDCPEVGYEVSSGAERRVRWKCSDGHGTWVTSPKNRTVSGGTGCPECAQGRRVAHRRRRALPAIGETDLWTTHPQLAKQLAYPKDGYEVTAGSHRKLNWICPSGHGWSAAVSSRTGMGSGCPSCSLRATSKVENHVRKLLSQHFPNISENHTDRLPTSGGGRVSVDMFWSIENHIFICEYDGSFWHKDRLHKDSVKTERLLRTGYFVIRIRESVDSSGNHHLPPLNIVDSNLLQLCAPYEKGHENLTAVSEQIRDWAYEVAARQSSACSLDTVSDNL